MEEGGAVFPTARGMCKKRGYMGGKELRVSFF
jgi:hypothetical protein